MLNSLVERAVVANHDLRIAAARVTEARAELRITQGYMLPEVNFQGDYSKSRVSANGQPFPNPQIYQSRYSLGFDAAWEIDVFGGGRRAIEAGRADLDSW